MAKIYFGVVWSLGMTKAAMTNIVGKRNRSVYKIQCVFKTNARKIFTKKRWMEKLTGRENVGEWQRISRPRLGKIH